MKLNNKGFAITTILYGTLILFLLLFTSVLGILSTHKSRLNILINSANGSRDIATMKVSGNVSLNSMINKRGLYCVGDGANCQCYKYFKTSDIANCN